MQPPNQGAEQKSDFYRTNNPNSIDIKRKIKNMFEYRSDPFGITLNLLKHYFSLNTYKLLTTQRIVRTATIQLLPLFCLP